MHRHAPVPIAFGSLCALRSHFLQTWPFPGSPHSHAKGLAGSNGGSASKGRTASTGPVPSPSQTRAEGTGFGVSAHQGQ